MKNKKEYFVIKSKDKEAYLSIDSEIGLFESDSANLFCSDSYTYEYLNGLISEYESEFEFGYNPNNIQKGEFEIKKVELIYP